MIRPLNIAIVARWFPSSSQTFVLDHVVGLIDRGHRVRVVARGATAAADLHADYQRRRLNRITRHPPDPSASKLSKASSLASWVLQGGRPALEAFRRAYQAQDLPGRYRWQLAASAAAIQGQGQQPQILHAHFGPEGEEIAHLRRCGALRQPLVVSLHGFDLTRPLASGSNPYTLLFCEAARVLVTTQFMAKQARALGCPNEKLQVVPIGIQLEKFNWAPRQWQAGQTLKLLSVARLVEKKGIAFALRAVAQLAANGIAVHYTVVGDGPQRDELAKLAGELGIAASVRFCGAQGREFVLTELARCHLFLLPSVTAADGDAEGQGMVLQEAQACGIPVVATRHGGLPEGCIEGKTAVLVPERDGLAIAAAVLGLLERRESWAGMAEAGRAHIERHYRLDTHIKALEGIYSSLL